MDGVSDHPFRHIQKKYGKPAIVYTEFTSVEGVCHGATRLLTDFLYDETQRPVIAQIYGTTPKYFRQTAVLLCHLGFDGIDINMGCPAKNVAHSGAGAALIKTPKLAQEIIRATKQGIQDYLDGQHPTDCPDITSELAALVEERHALLPAEYQVPRLLPVSVKTRVGYTHSVVEEWIPTLLEMEPAAIALHGRTLNQHYGGSANWEVIGQAAALTRSTSTLLLGNGDITSHPQALELITQYQLNGVLIGRGAMGNPFVFLPETPEHPDRFEIAIEHAELYEQTFAHDPKYFFMPMRKHLGWYVRSVPEAAKLRAALFATNTAAEVKALLEPYLNEELV
jgi:tRNA-dihydrouridine synthase B